MNGFLSKDNVLCKLEEIYARGGNITQFINSLEKNECNSKNAILIGYEYQSGSYVELFKRDPERIRKSAIQIVDEISLVSKGASSIMEAGVGEATIFKHVTKSLDFPPEKCYGFDISWSRLRVAQDFLGEYAEGKQCLFVSELSSIPLCDNAIDIVYTSHSVEPNGGNEVPILKELFRVTGRYLLLYEPDYELAGSTAKARMEKHGFVKNLAGVAKSLGYNVVKHELLPYAINELNPVSITVIKKDGSDNTDSHKTPTFQCPISKTELVDCGDIYYAPQPKLMYPKINGIPCLLKNNAIMGCAYLYSPKSPKP